MNARGLLHGWLAAALLAVAGLAVAQSAALPSVTPSAVREGTTSQITVRARLVATNLILGSANAQLVAANGSAIVLGPLNDNGNAGDLTAGDGIYSGQFVVQALAEGSLGIRVSFATRGSLRRTLSPLARLAVAAADAPVTLAPAPLDAITVDLTTGDRIFGGRVIACFLAGTPYSAVKMIAATAGATPIGGLPAFGNCFQLGLGSSDAAGVAAAVATLSAQGGVQFAEPEDVIQGHSSCAAPGNPFCTDINFTQVLNMTQAHQFGEGQGAVIAIIDSGMAATHLGGSVLFPGMIVGSNFVDPGTPPADDTPDGHGTTVAAIAQAAAPKARLFITKALKLQPSGVLAGSPAAVALAMAEAVDNGADVLNLSLGSFRQGQLMLTALNLVQSYGRIIVAAAGNEGTSVRSYPAAHVGAIAVGNTDSQDLRWNGPVFPSNFGFWVNIAAPGVDIVGTPGITGTSFSAPWVSGTVALMLSKYGAMTEQKVRDQLFRTAMPIPANATQDTCPALPCNQDLGSGRVDPAAALGAIRLTRTTAVGASGSFIARSIDVSIRNAAGSTLYSITMSFLGQANQCQVKTKVDPPCIQTIPFDFAALPAGSYQLRLSFAAQAASYFGTAQLTAPGAVFTSVALGSGGVNAADPTRADYSLFGAGTSRTTIFNIVKP